MVSTWQLDEDLLYDDHRSDDSASLASDEEAAVLSTFYYSFTDGAAPKTPIQNHHHGETATSTPAPQPARQLPVPKAASTPRASSKKSSKTSYVTISSSSESDRENEAEEDNSKYNVVKKSVPATSPARQHTYDDGSGSDPDGSGSASPSDQQERSAASYEDSSSSDDEYTLLNISGTSRGPKHEVIELSSDDDDDDVEGLEITHETRTDDGARVKNSSKSDWHAADDTNLVTGRSRYYLNAKQITCNNCEKQGHIMRDCTEPKVLLTDSRDYVQRSKRLTFIVHSENPSVPPMRQARALELRLPGRAVLQLPFPRPPCPCSPNSCWRSLRFQPYLLFVHLELHPDPKHALFGLQALWKAGPRGIGTMLAVMVNSS